MSGRPGRSRRVRYVGGDREERVEEEEERDVEEEARDVEEEARIEMDSDEYDDIDNPRDQGSQEATGGQGRQ